MRKYCYIYIIGVLAGFSACTDDVTEGKDPLASAENIIQVGGLETDLMSITQEVNTRAVETSPAEEKSWLRQPLIGGLDITYGKVNGETKHAKLKLVSNSALPGWDAEKGYNVEGNFAIYTFNQMVNGEEDLTKPAVWDGNGAHFFEGVYVPDEIRYKPAVSETIESIYGESGSAPNLNTDQSNDTETGTTLGNYTLLSHYLGMPAGTRISATVQRITLPFRHRLARVIAYILIDPSMGLDVTIQGFKKDADGHDVDVEDPSTTSILFRNVQVLGGVKETIDTEGLHLFTPIWETKQRVTPHFHGLRESRNSNNEVKAETFMMFVDNDTNTPIFPTDDSKWTSAKSSWESKYNAAPATADTEGKKIAYANEESGYTCTDYGKVPTYDLIVRPTYTSESMVMYDEDYQKSSTETGKKTKKQIAALTNQIDFDITLSNGLQYEKSFEFDLDANYQTVVYLRISREHVDYNSSGSEKWVQDERKDGYYGLNNENGNTLSKAGSSWQRAYTSVESFFSEVPNTSSGVTDGQFYNADKNENDNAQYYTATYDAQWIEKFLQARPGGEHHGDYFILKKDITIDATLIPSGFVFTGHLDGQDYTITLTNTAQSCIEWFKTTDYTRDVPYYFAKDVTSEYQGTSLYTMQHFDAVPYSEDELTEIEGVKYVTTSLDLVPEVPPVYYEGEDTEVIRVVIEKGKEAKETASKKPGDLKKAAVGEPDSPDYVPAEYYTIDEIEDAITLVTAGEEWEKIAIKTPGIPAHYVKNDDSILGSTPKEEAKDVFTLVEGAVPFATFMSESDNTYYKRSGEEGNYTYTPYSKPAIVYTMKDRVSNSYLFDGLNGDYRTAQEDDKSAVWEANVHEETTQKLNGKYYKNWVPTLGYRAEVMNVKVSGGTLFKDSPVPYTGNVQNCFNGTTPVPNKTPAIPQYYNNN